MTRFVPSHLMPGCFQTAAGHSVRKNIKQYNRREFFMTQDELREKLKIRTIREKQKYIAETTNIDRDTLSRFKLGRGKLNHQEFQRLETYLSE